MILEGFPEGLEPVMSRYASLWQLYLSRLREFYRQPARIFWVYGFPIIMAVGLGLAFRSRPPDTIVITVADSPETRWVSSALASLEASEGAAGRPRLQGETLPEEEALRLLMTGKTPLVVQAGPSGIVYRYDRMRPEANSARAAVDDLLQRAKGRSDPLPTSDVIVTEPGSRYIDFLVPGLMGLNTLGGGLWGVGFLIVNFRINKLLKRFMATPMPRSHFLLAILGARLTFLIPDMTVLLAVGHYGFGMPIRGSLALVVLIEVVAALAFSGIGLLVAARTKTTEAVSGLMNLIMLPMWLFSGVFFSSERFPAAIQPFVRALPLTQSVAALRRVILEGAGLADVTTALLVLGAWAIVTFVLALRLFRWN